MDEALFPARYMVPVVIPVTPTFVAFKAVPADIAPWVHAVVGILVLVSDASGCVAVDVGGFVEFSEISAVFCIDNAVVFITTISEKTLDAVDVDKCNVEGALAFDCRYVLTPFM